MLKEIISSVLNVRTAERSGEPTPIRVVKTITRNSRNPSLNSNGGDYDFSEIRYFHATTGAQIGLTRYLTSADFGWCEWCGQFESGECPCERGLSRAEERARALTLDIRRALYDDFETGKGPVRAGKFGKWQLVEYVTEDLDPLE